MAHAPLYGRFDWADLDLLVQRLSLISEKGLAGTAFTAYLVTRSTQKYYGLSLEELTEHYLRHQGEIMAFSASACSFSGMVVRINVRFHQGLQGPQAQFIIGTGSKARNRAIREMLEGKWSGEAIVAEKEGKKSSSQSRWQDFSIPAFSVRPKLPNPFTGMTYDKPTLTLTDHFYFDPYTTADAIVTLLNRLSNTFLDGALFHLRLETTDGDYHMHLDRAQLDFMFQHRREKLLMIYMDAASLDGQWINLRLSYHPLLTGPNGEMDVTSHQADEIMAVVSDNLGLAIPPPTIPARLQTAFHFDAGEFSLSELVRSMEEISRYYLQRIPPVAFLSTHYGQSFTGLSMYQLKKIFGRHQQDVAVLSLGITHVMTGQTMSLMYQFPEKKAAPTASLSMMWGDSRKHEAVQTLLEERLGLEPGVNQAEAAIPDLKTVPATSLCLVNLPWEAHGVNESWRLIQEVMEEAGLRVKPFKAQQAHQQWDETMQAVHEADLFLADFTYQQADILYRLGIAQAMGKTIIGMIQDDQAIPPHLQELPLIPYTNNREGRALMAQELAVRLGELG